MTEELFATRKPLVGVIHVGALPGTPRSGRSVDELTEFAVREAAAYREGGVDALMIENMHDVPYLRGSVGPEVVAAMAVVGRAVKSESGLPTGVQILAGANLEAIAVAHASGLDYVRVEAYTFAHVADEGIIESSAAELLRFRRKIGAERVRVWADVKKKHASHAITADVSLGETAAAVEFMLGDAVIVSGNATGEPPRAVDVREAKSHCRLPVLLGSGVTPENVSEFYDTADGFIVGSYFKEGGLWSNAVERARVERLADALLTMREPSPGERREGRAASDTSGNKKPTTEES
jgi:membrane complex biogenesis BtpA family protein